MSTKLPQWTGAHHPAVSAINDLRASCRSGIEQHAAYVGGAKLMMAVGTCASDRMLRMLDTLTSVCQCTSCVVRRLKKENNRRRNPNYLGYWQQTMTGRKLNPTHVSGCLIRKPCEACNEARLRLGEELITRSCCNIHEDCRAAERELKPHESLKHCHRHDCEGC